MRASASDCREELRLSSRAQHLVLKMHYAALADVGRALPVARLIEAASDYVGLSDAAEILRILRQNMRKLVLAHSATFPAPFHEGTTTLWHLLDVLEWLAEKGGYAVPAGIVDVARATLSINAGKLRTRM